MVHYLVTYRFKPFMGRADVGEMMKAFGSVGPGPGTTAHYVRVDDRGGTIIGETDDIEGVHRNLLNYGEWMQFDLEIVLPVEEAVPQVIDYLG
jgi:hypothetical protein